MVKKGKQERTVIHLEMNGEHYYLGSLAAIYQFFDSKTLGNIQLDRKIQLSFHNGKSYYKGNRKSTKIK